MSRKKIPERIEVTCDGCGKLKGEVSFRHDATLNMDAAGLDYQGNAVGPGGWQLDLCDKCMMKAEKAVRAALEGE